MGVKNLLTDSVTVPPEIMKMRKANKWKSGKSEGKLIAKQFEELNKFPTTQYV